MYLDILHNETQKLPYVWVKDKPLLYIHQIVMRIGKCYALSSNIQINYIAGWLFQGAVGCYYPYMLINKSTQPHLSLCVFAIK